MFRKSATEDSENQPTETAIGSEDEMVEVLRIPSPIGFALVVGLMILSVSSLAALVAQFNRSDTNPFWSALFPVFWVGAERNVPTFFNFALLVVASGLLALCASSEQGRWRLHWGLGAFLLLFLAFDEAASLHEAIGHALKSQMETTGVFYYRWVIPGLIFLGCLVVMSFQFLLAQSPRVRALLVLAGVIYFGGSLGMEMVAAYLDYFDAENVRVATLIEETMEFAGAALVSVAALVHLRQRAVRSA